MNEKRSGRKRIRDNLDCVDCIRAFGTLRRKSELMEIKNETVSSQNRIKMMILYAHIGGAMHCFIAIRYE